MSFEFNKIFAAILLAGIVAKLSGFVSDRIFHVDTLAENAYQIEVAEEAAPGEPQVEKTAEPILALLATADIAKGQKLSKACAACHSFDNGGVNKIGPNIWNIVNASKASKSGFSYSDAMISKGGTWSYTELNSFLWKPKKHIPGTKMNYIGLKKPQQRADLIAWLRTLSSSPAALPSASAIAADK